MNGIRCSGSGNHKLFSLEYRLPNLLLELGMARSEGNYKKVLAKYAKPVLLILDE